MEVNNSNAIEYLHLYLGFLNLGNEGCAYLKEANWHQLKIIKLGEFLLIKAQIGSEIKDVNI